MRFLTLKVQHLREKSETVSSSAENQGIAAILLPRRKL